MTYQDICKWIYAGIVDPRDTHTLVLLNGLRFFVFFLRTDDDVHATIREAVAALNVPIGDPDPSKPRLRPMASSEKAKRMLKLQDFRSIGIIARDFMESLRERGFS